MKSKKVVATLGLLAVLVGATLFVLHPEANTAQEMIGEKELRFIHFAGVVLMFLGFYSVLVLLPGPKGKK